MFSSAADESRNEWDLRRKGIKTLRFGVDYLDDATRGILPDDLVLMSAASGAGKTQLCVNTALANLEDEKIVHYIALEAGEYEIMRRLKFAAVAERFFADSARPRLGRKFNFTDWYLGIFAKELALYEEEAAAYCEVAYKKLMLYHKGDKFGVTELIASVLECAGETDLILIDHFHYFDLEEVNENAAAKDIAKCLRDLIHSEGKPVILVAHLRKKHGGIDDELVPGMEEIHGGSDIYKIATKVITLAPGRPTSEGGMETFFRICKSRIDNSVNRYCGLEYFSPKAGGYERQKYKIGWADCKRRTGFDEIAGELYPYWAQTRNQRSDHAGAAESRDVTPARSWAADL